MKILIIEDEPGIYSFLQEGLNDEGYETIVASDGNEGIEQFWLCKPDLVLLDWMIPTIDGMEVCNRIRKKDIETPVIFLTAKDTVQETIQGLRAGANDYIKKPFSFDELLERIKIHFRNRSNDNLLKLADINMNLTTHKVIKDGREVQLTARQFNLLAYLIQKKGQIITRDEIIRDVWGIDFQYDTGVIDVFMNALRKKLDIKSDGPIKTVRGVGFIAND